MYSLFFLIIGFPILEIYLLIEIGAIIGAVNTILLIIFTAFTGVFFAKKEGLNTLRSGISQLMKNEMPLYEIFSGATLAIAALLLIFPGFISDALGFILIIPFTRKIILNLIISRMPKNNKSESGSVPIEGEYEDIKDDEKK